MKRATKYRKGQRVRCEDGRTGTLIRRNRPFSQWLVEMDEPHKATHNSDRLTWWWESTFCSLSKTKSAGSAVVETETPLADDGPDEARSHQVKSARHGACEANRDER